MPTRVMIKLFSLPATFVAAALASMLALSWWVPSQLGHVEIFASLAEASRRAAAPVVAACLLLAAMTTLRSLWRLYRWDAGRAPSCQRCGGLVVEKFSRRRIYQECLFCGRRD